jgi:anthranilate phosphoribosyltransferase
VGARKKAGRRTVFNLVGPLCNPAAVGVQVIGTADLSKKDELARALQLMGRRRALVVRGEPGIDEFSISGGSDVVEITPHRLRSFRLSPEECGISLEPYANLPSGLAPANAKSFCELLEGAAAASIRDLVALNAGAVLYVAGRAQSIKEGYIQAKLCVVDGRMKQKFDEYKRFVGERSSS